MRFSALLVIASLFESGWFLPDCSYPAIDDVKYIIAQSIIEGSITTIPTIVIIGNFHVICLAHSSVRNRYRSVSILVQYNCTGRNDCPSGTATEQFESDCYNDPVVGYHWSSRVLGQRTFTRTRNTSANYSTRVEDSCSFCASPQRARLSGAPDPENETHCISCDGCTKLNRCVDSPSDCCNVYLPNDTCATSCPPGLIETPDYICGRNCSDDLGNVLNGVVSYTQPYSNGSYVPGTVVTVECVSDDYEKDGDYGVLCLVNGTWNSSLPRCNIIECDSVPDLPHGMIESIPVTTRVGTEVSYKCDGGYRFKDSRTTRTCQINHIWSNPDLECELQCLDSMCSEVSKADKCSNTSSGTCEDSNQLSSESQSPAIFVAASIAVLILLIIIAIAIIALFLRYQHKIKAKYSFRASAISQISNGEYQDEDSDEEHTVIEMKDITMEEEDEDISQNDTISDKQEEEEVYFQDTTSLLPPSDAIPAENFPQYVRDMLYGGENQLKIEFSALDKLPRCPATVAILPHNKSHNRFKNIYPYDSSRVQLKQSPGIDGCDYINASFINGYDGTPNAYIAAQGPMNKSVERFWRMVWEYEVPTIVMLTQCTEAGKIKCVHYWPEKLHDVFNIEGKFSVTYCSSMPFAEYEFRKLKLENLVEEESKPMTVTHLHYTAWPDHGVPDNVMSLIAFIRHVRKIHPISHHHPLLVHCSAGVGRTGTLILLDIIMQQMKRENTISVLHWLRTIRLQRMKLVQSPQQYEFIHCGLSELVTCGETEVAAANLRIVLKRMTKTGEDGLNGFERQIKVIKEVSSHQPVTFNDARKEYNVSKNRFHDKLPSDGYRVRLRGGQLPGSDYINASFVNGYKQKGAYIATQCPMENTVDDFWRLINEFNCACIVLLQEHGEEGSYRFWPEEEGLSVTYGKLSVKLVSTKTHGDIVTSKLEIVERAAKHKRPQKVYFLQLTSWPPQAIPHPTAVLSLIDQLTSTLMKCTNRQTVIMCSDGVSRTGTFLTIHCQLERLKTEGVVDFLQAVKSARLQRPGIVNNTDHYVFCHEVANKYLDNFDTYANFEFKKAF